MGMMTQILVLGHQLVRPQNIVLGSEDEGLRLFGQRRVLSPRV
jgi:hypothetical protein